MKSPRASAAFDPAIECRCVGDPREMGFAQGRKLGSRIRHVREILGELEPFRLRQPKFMPYSVFLWLAELKASNALRPGLMPAQLERLEGVAAGAQISSRSLCLMNALEALISDVSPHTHPPLGACSALAVRGTRSFNGRPIIARNFDYLPFVQPFQIFRESRPRNGFRSLEFLIAPQVGAEDGINEKGLAITLNYAFVKDRGRPAPLITMAIADALANCSTVSEALERISNAPRWGAGMLMLADASGDIASLELSNTRAAHRRPVPGEDTLWFTNVCVCPETRQVQIPDGHIYSDQVPAALRRQPVLQWHADRASRIGNLVGSASRLGPNELASIMADHGPSGIPDGTTPCVHTDYWRTTACLQWYPAERRVRVAFANPCAAKYVDLSL